MTDTLISNVKEINCNKDKFLEALYKPKIWELNSPVKEIHVTFRGPNILYSEMVDEIDLIKVPIEMSGELVMIDKGEVPDKGRLIELNVRNNKDVETLEARLRIKSLSDNKTKIGVFIHSFKLTSDFLNLVGDASELILRRKLSELMRNLQSYLKNNSIDDLI